MLGLIDRLYTSASTYVHVGVHAYANITLFNMFTLADSSRITDIACWAGTFVTANCIHTCSLTSMGSCFTFIDV